MAYLIYGTHACYSALSNPDIKIIKIYLVKNKTYQHNITNRKNVVFLEDLNYLFKDKNTVHQNIAMEIEMNLHEFQPENLNKIAILDNITDPHNFGAIIRSAAAFNIQAIITHDRSSCKLSGTVFKSASGGINFVKVHYVKNLANIIKKLKECGFWITALCEQTDKFLHEIDLTGKTCLILGAEGSGIRQLQIRNADFIAKIPTGESFSTLNVSNAAAIAFYEIFRQNSTSSN